MYDELALAFELYALDCAALVGCLRSGLGAVITFTLGRSQNIIYRISQLHCNFQPGIENSQVQDNKNWPS